MRERPLSPHLSIYRFGYTLTSSISNRITGIVLSGGLLLLVYWLVAAASSEQAYEDAYRTLSHGVARVLLAVILTAFVYHFLAGIRHLIWDMGYALERDQARASAWLIGAATLVISGILIYFVFLAGGASP
ncbi:MAG: succinate dehydrogenase, cytochrome b556 subunit [Gammaproteobacteria bacterium]